MTILATRARHCPACAASVTERRARWCGSCGELLAPRAPDGPAAGTDPTPTRAGRWRRGAVTLGVIVAGGVFASLVGDDLVDRVVPASTAVQDVAVRTPDAATLGEVRQRRPPPPPPLEEPMCVDGPAEACFAWRVEARGSGFDAALPAGDVVVVAETLTGYLAGIDLDDGSTRWELEGAPSNPSGVTIDATGELLLHPAGDALVARDTATGIERWSTEELGRVVPYDVRILPDGVVVTAGRHGITRNDGSFEMVVAGLDADTGEVRWRHGGADVGTLAGGATQVTAFDGTVRVIGPDGTERWARDGLFDARSGGGAWGVGHVITVSDVGGNRMLLASTGDELDMSGNIVGGDDEHTLVEVWTETEGGGQASDGQTYLSVALALVDDGGVVWQAPLEGWSGCVNDVDLTTAAEVQLTTCEGGTLVLDRDDGTMIGHQPAPAPPAAWSAASPDVIPAFGRDTYGPYTLGHVDVGTGRHPELVVIDVVSGTHVARLPTDTWPAWAPIGADEGVVGDRFVLQSQRWVTALPVPEEGAARRAQ